MLTALIRLFSPRAHYRYHIERVTADGIEGWVYHQRHRNPCRVQVMTMNRELIAEGTTEHLRSELDNRTCGFRLPNSGRKLHDLTPGRAMLVVDGIRLSTLYFFAPVDASVLERELLERHEILSGLKVDRLERENDQLTRRVAELEMVLQRPQGPRP